MNGSNRKWFFFLFVLNFVSLIGCQRSPAFRRDQDFYKPDEMSYYASKAKSPINQIEAMGQPRKRVLVLNFWNNTPIQNSDVGAFAADELKRGFFLTQKLVVPTDFQEKLKTEDFVDGERVKVAQLIREGRRAGVSILVIGRLKRVVFRKRGDDIGILRQKQSLAGVDVEAKVFDVAAGREILNLARSGESTSNEIVAFEVSDVESPQVRKELTQLATRNAVGQMIPEIVRAVEKISWEGRIVKVVGTKVYINAGKASGISAGDILRVMTPGEDIHDSETGAFLGRAQGEMKGTLEVLELFGTDGAVGEIHTGGNPMEGDRVQLY